MTDEKRKAMKGTLVTVFGLLAILAARLMFPDLFRVFGESIHPIWRIGLY